jgi:hypothetical protein
MITGQQLAEEGGRRALAHAELHNMAWGDRAYRALLFLRRGRTEFTVEQVKPEAYARGLPVPPAEGAWGPITKRLVREGRIEFSRYMDSRNPSQHGKPVKVWRIK